MNLESLSTRALRDRARRRGFSIRFYRNYDRLAGNEQFCIADSRSHVVGLEPSEQSLRRWLIDMVREDRRGDF